MGLFANRTADDELQQLVAEVARMGGMAESQVADAVQSIARRDVTLAHAVTRGDDRIDDAQREIERRAVALIAARRHSAHDLRRIVSSLKLAAGLERTGDLARNIAKRAQVIAGSEPMPPLVRSIERMGLLVVERMKEALDAYATRELDRAMSVWARDEEVDEHYNSIFRELLTYMMADQRTITPCTHLLFVAKNLERIGDHATGIAEIVHYEETGAEPPADRPKAVYAL